MVSNAVLISDTGGKLFKIGKNQPHQKIDGLVTAVMGLGLAMIGEDDENGSYMDNHDTQWVEI